LRSQTKSEAHERGAKNKGDDYNITFLLLNKAPQICLHLY